MTKLELIKAMEDIKDDARIMTSDGLDINHIEIDKSQSDGEIYVYLSDYNEDDD